MNLDTQSAQRADHHARIFAVERAGKRRTAVGQRGTDQSSIRNAFRSRGTNRRMQRAGWLDGYAIGHDEFGTGEGVCDSDQIILLGLSLIGN
jgi:hypothetical protein